MSASITTGDDAVIMHTLKKNGKTFNIPGTAIVTCRLITMNHDILTDEVIQSIAAAGADWSNSLVTVVLPAAITSQVLNTPQTWRNGEFLAKLETQVFGTDKFTWFETVTISKGTIN